MFATICRCQSCSNVDKIHPIVGHSGACTSNAVRVVDVPEQLAKALRDYIVGRSGLLFATRDGKPLSQRNVLRSFHDTGATCRFHALRRFRAETLRCERVPEDLVRFWLGHASASVTDTYANGLREDFIWRQDWVQRTGLGFDGMGYSGLQKSLKLTRCELRNCYKLF